MRSSGASCVFLRATFSCACILVSDLVRDRIECVDHSRDRENLLQSSFRHVGVDLAGGARACLAARRLDYRRSITACHKSSRDVARSPAVLTAGRVAGSVIMSTDFLLYDRCGEIRMRQPAKDKYKILPLHAPTEQFRRLEMRAVTFVVGRGGGGHERLNPLISIIKFCSLFYIVLAAAADISLVDGTVANQFPFPASINHHGRSSGARRAAPVRIVVTVSCSSGVIVVLSRLCLPRLR
ncbi:hypothetical protein EVAR_667_1 [Eumeta japonica]|uniref:Uncharacterized protein n=1 Tax=Eumeta variegata TaxID=151549 RepID=A0A4C1SBE1_EUMVA|nr:hypothetical protein EVAR_667_1 [Eumeta japonica]